MPLTPSLFKGQLYMYVYFSFKFQDLLFICCKRIDFTYMSRMALFSISRSTSRWLSFFLAIFGFSLWKCSCGLWDIFDRVKVGLSLIRFHSIILLAHLVVLLSSFHYFCRVCTVFEDFMETWCFLSVFIPFLTEYVQIFIQVVCGL